MSESLARYHLWMSQKFHLVMESHMLIAIGDFQHKVEDGKAYKEPFCIINIIPDNEHILF